MDRDISIESDDSVDTEMHTAQVCVAKLYCGINLVQLLEGTERNIHGRKI